MRVEIICKIKKWKSRSKGKVYYRYSIPIPPQLGEALDLSKKYRVIIEEL